MEEEWLSVVGADERYEVSNFGRVRSVDRIVVKKNNGSISEHFYRGKMLKPGCQLRSGHFSVAIGRGNSRPVHQLVLEAFVGPRPIGMEALHWDDNPGNNKLDNLRWGTRSQNLHDAVRNGKKKIGSSVSNSKLDKQAVTFIRQNQGFMSLNALGRKFGVSAQAVKQVIKGTTWKDKA